MITRRRARDLSALRGFVWRFLDDSSCALGLEGFEGFRAGRPRFSRVAVGCPGAHPPRVRSELRERLRRRGSSREAQPDRLRFFPLPRAHRKQEIPEATEVFDLGRFSQFTSKNLNFVLHVCVRLTEQPISCARPPRTNGSAARRLPRL